MVQIYNMRKECSIFNHIMVLHNWHGFEGRCKIKIRKSQIKTPDVRLSISIQSLFRLSKFQSLFCNEFGSQEL